MSITDSSAQAHSSSDTSSDAPLGERHHPVQGGSDTPLHVLVLIGGPSQEREVSLKTGDAIVGALRRLGYRVTTFDPDIEAPKELIETLHRERPDLVFNALHGLYGEDGVIQGVLEWMRVPYTGAKLTSSALAMDKGMSRSLFANAGVEVASGLVWTLGAPYPSRDDLPSGPWIIKPTREGSSVGLDLCQSYDELLSVLKSKSVEGPSDWLIEEYVQGVEVSVVVFEGTVWGSVEVAPSEGLYDYEAKYERGDTQYFCPPRLTPEVISRVEEYGRRAYQALGCVGICRADLITTDTGKDERGLASREVILEVNTLPGMTETSLVPKVAAARGVEFDKLVELIVKAELKRLNGAP